MKVAFPKAFRALGTIPGPALGLVLTVACGDAPNQDASVAPQGRAAKGTFSFVEADGVVRAFPATIPAGTHFRMTYLRNGRIENGPDVKVVSPVLVRREGTELVAIKPGVSVFFVEDVAGHVLDEIAVAIVPGSAP